MSTENVWEGVIIRVTIASSDLRRADIHTLQYRPIIHRGLV